MLKEGTRAIEFELMGSDNKMHKLSEFSGKTLVLYFYPKDDTPGCTIEAKKFTENIEQFNALGAFIIGISRDNYDSHCAFRDKHGLKILLLSDPSAAVLKAYESLGMLGIASRNTYIIDKNGIIVKAYQKVNPNTHADEVLSYLASMKNAENIG